MEEANGEDIVLRINSPGGDVFAGWGIVAKMTECTGKTTVKVDGAAMSMAVMPVVFADFVECLDVSTLMVHRASMLVENDEDQAFLDNVNKNLRSKLETKINDDALFEMKGIRIKNLFEDEKRIDLFLDSKEAKKLGLVNKINKLTPELQLEMSAMNRFKIAAIGSQTQTSTKMTKAEFKAANPDIYAEILEEGKTIGATAMKEVAQVWAHFLPVDAKAAADGIKSGLAPTPLQIVELTTKMASAVHLRNIGAENADPTTTGEQPKGDAALTAEQKVSKQAEAEFDKAFEALRKTNKII